MEMVISCYFNNYKNKKCGVRDLLTKEPVVLPLQDQSIWEELHFKLSNPNNLQMKIYKIQFVILHLGRLLKMDKLLRRNIKVD